MNETFFKFALKKMPINKNAWIRYLTLDRCFRNTGRKYYIDDLVDACNEALLEDNPNSSGIKKRQIFNDINYMRSSKGFNAPIESYRDGNRTYYRYEDTNFSILQQLLPQNIIEISQDLFAFLIQIDGLAPIQELHDKLPELLKFYKIKQREPFVEFDFNLDYVGLKNFSPMFNAINHQQVLEITYDSYFKKKIETFIFHPHYLKEYRQRWYVLGYNETENIDCYILGLERIVDFKELRNKHYFGSTVDYKEYFYDIIGVTKELNKKPEKINLLIHPDFEKYILTRPFHPSQINKNKFIDGWREIELEVIINEELVNHLIPYMQFIKILGPPALIDIVKYRLSEGLKNLDSPVCANKY